MRLIQNNYWSGKVCKTYRARQIPVFVLENALKKTTEYFLKFLFLFASTILPINKRI